LAKGRGKYRLAQDWGVPPVDCVPNQPVIVSERIAQLAEAINRKDGGMTFFVEYLTDEGLPLSAKPKPVVARPAPVIESEDEDEEFPFEPTELEKHPQTFVEDLTPAKKKAEKPKAVVEDEPPPKPKKKKLDADGNPIKKKKKKLGPDGKPIKKKSKVGSDGIW
jgi:hypothetical protein